MRKILSFVEHKHVWYTSVLAAFIVAVSAFSGNPAYFPSAGIALSLFTLTTLTFITREKRDWFSTSLFLLSVCTSAYICIYANPFSIFLNIATSIFLISVAALRDISFTNVIFSPMITGLATLQSNSDYAPKKIKKIHLPEHFITSLIITLIILFIMIPLLSEVNLIFEKLVRSVMQMLYIENIISWIFNTNYFLTIFRAVFFGLLVFFLPRFVTIINAPQSKKEIFSSFPSLLKALTIPKFAVIGVLLIFFVSQIQLYFATDERLIELGYTNSMQTREVFAQLAVVALIVFILIYNDKHETYKSRFTTYILIVQGFFLTAMAFFSDYSYIASWGFTHKRLYGLAFVVWIVGLFGLFTYKYVRRTSDALFVKLAVILTGVIIISINVVNFDELIVSAHKVSAPEGIDYSYMAYYTYDSNSYEDLIFQIQNTVKEHINSLNNEANNSVQWNTMNNYENSARMISFRSQNMVEKYFSEDDRFDWRNFNLSEYRFAVRVKGDTVDEIQEAMKEILNMLMIRSNNNIGARESASNANPPIVQKSLTTIELRNVPAELLQENFELRSIPTNQVILQGSFDGTSIFRTLLYPGEYAITVYTSRFDQETGSYVPFKTIHAQISQQMIDTGYIIIAFQ